MVVSCIFSQTYVIIHAKETIGLLSVSAANSHYDRSDIIMFLFMSLFAVLGRNID